MSFFTSAAAVCFIASHGGPADHFATFTERLSKEVAKIDIYASGPALTKFQERGITVKCTFSADDINADWAKQLTKICSSANVVITDVGHPSAIAIQEALATEAPHILRLAYYDNPEAYVPGGYSATATKVMQASQGVLFANSHLAETMDLGTIKKIGLGYYPTKPAEKIAKRRLEEKGILRQKLLENNNITDNGQKVLVYFGGNNEEYFLKAFPAFLSLLEQGMTTPNFQELVVVLQQHPGAKKTNTDRNQCEEWAIKHIRTAQIPKIVISNFSSDEAQIVADGALYYQTSMGPQFVLAGIPTMQIGHETYEDILVKNDLIPSITNVDQLLEALGTLKEKQIEVPQKVLFNGLGIKEDWLQILEQTIKTANSSLFSSRQISLSGFTVKKAHLPYYLAAFGVIFSCFLAHRFLRPRHCP
jgi:hypothetical protein